MELLEKEIRILIDLALKEDKVDDDITARSCLAENDWATAGIFLKQDAVVAGLIFLPWIFTGFDLNLCVQEGLHYQAGEQLATIKGPARRLLSLERTAVNLLQHCSGIATATAEYVKAVSAYQCDILDTRKTLPGLRQLQKYAVRVGGGKNHRFDLSERILIKNNHLALCNSVAEAVKRAKESHANVEVEVENLAMVKEALEAGADLILLDNMGLDMTRAAVEQIQKRAYIEASGNMTLPRVASVAETGVNGISIGALTHSVKAIDISLRIIG